MRHLVEHPTDIAERRVLLGGRKFGTFVDSATTFAALQRGLERRKQADKLSRALTESGFFNVNVRDWRSIQAR